MRAAVSLGGLLVVIAIVVYLFAKNASVVIPAGKKAQDEARQMSGHGDDGIPADRTIKLDAESGGPLKYLIVTDVTPGGAMDKFYGFKKDDKITAIGQNEVSNWNDFELAKAMLVQEGYEKMQPVTVIRDGNTIQLPLKAGDASSTGTANAPTPQTPDASASPQQQSIQNQLNKIKIPGQ
jgi:S1-C subfamily serine protease